MNHFEPHYPYPAPDKKNEPLNKEQKPKKFPIPIGPTDV